MLRTVEDVRQIQYGVFGMEVPSKMARFIIGMALTEDANSRRTERHGASTFESTAHTWRLRHQRKQSVSARREDLELLLRELCGGGRGFDVNERRLRGDGSG